MFKKTRYLWFFRFTCVLPKLCFTI